MGALEGKVALVTGAASGLGRESAKLFAREGARVVVVDINREGGDETVAVIEDDGGEATFVAADVSRSADAQAMVQAAVDAYGGLDCAHNNAAISLPNHPLADVSEDDWNRVWTPMLRARASSEPGHIERLEAMHPIGRLAEPEEVAQAAVWCTDAASFVLGHTLSVEGGYVIH